MPMKNLRMKAVMLALIMTVGIAVQPAHAQSDSILDLVNRASNVAAAVQQVAPAEEETSTEAVESTVSFAAPAAENEPAPVPFEKGMITGGTINVRTGPSTNCDRITQVCTGKTVDVLGVDNGWFRVQFGDTVGYVLGDYVTEYDPNAVAASTVGQQVAALAMQYMGTRYRSGGAAPGGFDCSGFTMYLYSQFGYSLPHSATSQYRNCGTHVSKSELQPGDLVFFSDSSHAIGHVGLYIGNGQIIHARYSVGCVTTNYLSESYYTNRYVGATRIA